jgi:hypothetical protein
MKTAKKTSRNLVPISKRRKPLRGQTDTLTDVRQRGPDPGGGKLRPGAPRPRVQS